MKISRERLKKAHPNLPAEVYYTASGRVRFENGSVTVHAVGSTPAKAKLNWLWSAERRRHRVED